MRAIDCDQIATPELAASGARSLAGTPEKAETIRRAGTDVAVADAPVPPSGYPLRVHAP
jgi:hypothetical protein